MAKQTQEKETAFNSSINNNNINVNVNLPKQKRPYTKKPKNNFLKRVLIGVTVALILSFITYYLQAASDNSTINATQTNNSGDLLQPNK